MNAPILIVEDHDPDFETTSRGFKRLGVTNPVERFADGDEVLARLRHHDLPLPALVLLDLNLPTLNGREVISAIRADRSWRAIPVVVLSASERTEDVAECYQRGANSFIPKRMSPTEQHRDLENLTRYWLDTVKLPLKVA